MEGFICINKPEGYSSFKSVAILRHKTGVKKIGHAGTLDPFASGLLIMAIGKKFTRQIQAFQDLEKEYQFTMVLGQSTPTLDPESDIHLCSMTPPPLVFSNSKIEEILASFKGKQDQTPPQFSAKKIQGKRAYKLARSGKPVSLAPCSITIHDLQILDIKHLDYPEITLSCRCSKGTYIRQLAWDIGQKLGVPAYTKQLIRTAIGPYTQKGAIDSENATESDLKAALFTTLK